MRPDTVRKCRILEAPISYILSVLWEIFILYRHAEDAGLPDVLTPGLIGQRVAQKVLDLRITLHELYTDIALQIFQAIDLHREVVELHFFVRPGRHVLVLDVFLGPR